MHGTGGAAREEEECQHEDIDITVVAQMVTKNTFSVGDCLDDSEQP